MYSAGIRTFAKAAVDATSMFSKGRTFSRRRMIQGAAAIGGGLLASRLSLTEVRDRHSTSRQVSNAEENVDLRSRQTPSWYDEAKLGLFVTWNPASIPAFAPLVRVEDLLGVLKGDADLSELWRRLPHAAMYSNTMAVAGSATARYHAEHYGDSKYDMFVDQFRNRTIPDWSSEPWADLFAQSGARYVVLTTKLPDGFLLWPSSHLNPHKKNWHSDRDVVGELATAVRARGMRFGTYYCGGVDQAFGGPPIADRESARAAMSLGNDYLQYAEAHWRELIDRYEPSVLWNDFGLPEGADIAALFRWYFARVPDGVVNNRFEAVTPSEQLKPSKVYSDFVTPEYTTDVSFDVKWETCRGMGLSFGYNRQESEKTRLTVTELIHMFVDIVARGGNLLLDVGPTGTGQIPWAQAHRLLSLGWWLRANGDAIYGTRPWTNAVGITVDGLGVRYTMSHDAVHAIVLGTPRMAAVDIDVRLDRGAEVSLEGSRRVLSWQATPAGVRVELPEISDEGPTLNLRMAPISAVHEFNET